MEPPRTWLAKFGDAFRGTARAVASQSSFAVHLPVAALAVAVAAFLGMSLVEWCLIALAIGLVLAAEVLNTALEFLAKAVTREYDANVRDALDVASAGVFVTVITAVVVGAILLGNRAGSLLGWW